MRYSYASLVTIIIANYIRQLGWRARPLPTANSPYLVAPTFIDAGMGEYGRCGYVVTKEFGNNWRPGAVATDLPLAPDAPVDFGLQDFCEKCEVCAATCAAGAIPRGRGARVVVRGVRRWQIDPVKCYSYWKTSGHVCGTCQSVCPWNHRNNLFHNVLREICEGWPGARGLLLGGENAFYRHRPHLGPAWLEERVE